jgi:hypothetical protein
MATDACAASSEHRPSIEVVHAALADLSTGRREFEQFLTGLFDQWRELWEQCALVERERAMLQSQLEAARRHNAKLAETLAGQQRRNARQQRHWGGELKQLRRLLEEFVGRQAQAGNPP